MNRHQKQIFAYALVLVGGYGIFLALGVGMMAAVQLVLPNASTSSYETIITQCIAGAGALLLLILKWLLAKVLPEETRLPPIETLSNDRQAQVVDEVLALRDQIDTLRDALERRVRESQLLRRFARGMYASWLAFLVAVIFAVGNLACAGLEGTVRRAWPLDSLSGLSRMVNYFALSISLLPVALLVPLLAYWRFLKRARSRGWSHVFKIGFVGVFSAGVISLFMVGPETLGRVLQGVPGPLEYVNLGYVPFLFATRLMVYPLVGLFGCAALRGTLGARLSP